MPNNTTQKTWEEKVTRDLQQNLGWLVDGKPVELPDAAISTILSIFEVNFADEITKAKAEKRELIEKEIVGRLPAFPNSKMQQSLSVFLKLISPVFKKSDALSTPTGQGKEPKHTQTEGEDSLDEQFGNPLGQIDNLITQAKDLNKTEGEGE